MKPIEPGCRAVCIDEDNGKYSNDGLEVTVIKQISLPPEIILAQGYHGPIWQVDKAIAWRNIQTGTVFFNNAIAESHLRRLDDEDDVSWSRIEELTQWNPTKKTAIS